MPFMCICFWNASIYTARPFAKCTAQKPQLFGFLKLPASKAAKSSKNIYTWFSFANCIKSTKEKGERRHVIQEGAEWIWNNLISTITFSSENEINWIPSNEHLSKCIPKRVTFLEYFLQSKNCCFAKHYSKYPLFLFSYFANNQGNTNIANFYLPFSHFSA